MAQNGLIDLDDERAHDPLVVGAKAARLADARRAGLPVLPGVVLPVEIGRAAVASGGQALAAGGSGRARLAAMEVEVAADVLDALSTATASLGEPVVVRSSSPLEGDSAWAGTFSSFDGIRDADLRTAVRGVWASAFTVHALERCEAIGVDPAGLELAVLVQPEIFPACGGSARLFADGTVGVHACAGAPRDLLEGWEVGVRARVAPDGRVLDGDAVASLGDEPVAAAVDLVRRTNEALGDDLVEWAWADDRIVLLQSSRLPEVAPRVAHASDPALVGDPAVLTAAQLVYRFPGPLGERLVLPWAFAIGRDLPAPELPRPSDDPAADLHEAIELASVLVKQAWQQRTGNVEREVAAALTSLRGSDPLPALEHLMSARRVDPEQAAEVLRLFGNVAAALVNVGQLRTARRLWRLTPTELRGSVGNHASVDDPLRHGPDRWEPFVHAVVRGNGTTVEGVPVVPGIAAGRVVVVRDPHAPPPFDDRDVLVTARPLPAIAPMLWRAGALVTSTGNPAAHLMEVATSLAVPTVLGADLSAFGGLSGLAEQELLAAVDGDDGSVTFAQLAVGGGA
jgi:phosphohistidine swiveling domain-containing protein